MLVFLLYVIPNYTSPPDSNLDLSPSFIPSLAVAVVLFLSILLGITTLFTKDIVGGLHEEFGVEATGIGWLEIKNLGLWLVLSAVAWFGTTYIGFEPTMTVCLATGLIFCGLRSHWLTAVIAVLTPIILAQGAWFVFTTELPGFWRT